MWCDVVFGMPCIVDSVVGSRRRGSSAVAHDVAVCCHPNRACSRSRAEETHEALATQAL